VKITQPRHVHVGAPAPPTKVDARRTVAGHNARLAKARNDIKHLELAKVEQELRQRLHPRYRLGLRPVSPADRKSFSELRRTWSAAVAGAADRVQTRPVVQAKAAHPPQPNEVLHMEAQELDQRIAKAQLRICGRC